MFWIEYIVAQKNDVTINNTKCHNRPYKLAYKQNKTKQKLILHNVNTAIVSRKQFGLHL